MNMESMVEPTTQEPAQHPANRKRYALVWCSELLALSDGEKFVEQFRSKGEHWDILSPADPDFLERTNGYDGFIVSGSEKSLVDDCDSPFVARILAFIKSTFERPATPVLGICFGAQAIAVSLGGKVGRNPDGNFRLGVETLEWVDGIDPRRWPEAQTPSVVIQSHGEHVQELPVDTTLLAGSKAVPHEVFLVGDRFLGIQGHPEMDIKMLSEQFLNLHRQLFSDTQWKTVEEEVKKPIDRKALLTLGRRLLDEGQL
jgi:GMP synthase (glutamine-hydrolysing)